MKNHLLCLLTVCLMTSACGSSTQSNTPCPANELPPPSAPANLTNTAAPSTMVDLTWDAPTETEDVTEHWIYRCSGMYCLPTRYQSGITETTFGEIGLALDTLYRYAVSALDSAGNQSPLSAIYELTTPPLQDTGRPTPPSDVTVATVSSTQIDIGWTASMDDSGVIAFYSVYRCQGTCSPGNAVATGVKTTTFKDTIAASSTTYTYAVTAFDAAGNESLLSSAISATTQAAPVAQTYTFIGAGDIASSINNAAESTAKLLDTAVAADSNTIVFTAGDNVHPCGSASEYSTYYEPTWGRHKARTRPSPGNHDYETSGASGYLNYFCPNSDNCSFPKGTKRLYYSYDLGNWHLISLNSEQINSSQLTWLQNDLATHSDSCILAYWHKPRFTSGIAEGNKSEVQPFWDALYAMKANVVVVAHEHNYERFAKMSAGGSTDPNGIRQFVVGTGGAVNFGFGLPEPNSEVRLTNIKGVIKFSLHNEGYDWTFVPSTNTNLGDSGSDTCNK